jgi:pyruvate dehydrogenase E2 component (dihydrolipoamide acetyltransferase)
MAEVIRMPLLSDTMKEGKIAAWLKNIGDVVKSDDVLAEVETDKATMEVIGYEDGTLLYKGAENGKAVAVNGILAVVGKPGENIDDLIKDNSGSEAISAPAVREEATVAPAVATETVKIPKELEVIQMPLLSDTMKEGKIAAWLKQVGDTVKSDDVIAEVETDKATMEVIGYAEGTLLYQGAEVGKGVLVNGTLAVVGPKDFDITPYLASLTSVASASAVAAETPAAAAPIAVAPAPTSAPIATPTPTSNVVINNGRVIASPLAKKLASEKGLDLRTLQGTGDGGRIILRDVANANASAAVSAPAAPAAIAPSFDASQMQEGHHDVELTQMRKIIAQRLGESKFSAPHFYLKISVALDSLLDIRKQINAAQPVKVSINDMLIKACALSLRKHPDVNVSWRGDTIRYNHHINIGSAIALPDGLIVPVIKFADAKTLPQIASDANLLYDKAKNKKIQPADFTGNTFTISNLGMMDIEEFTAIINPPDAAILAVGKGTPTPVVNDKGEVVIKTMLKLTLSCDHRAIDGAVGASFLQTLKHFIENPIGMFL